MSWARVDDSFWKHEKVKPLIEAEEWQALALWLLGISYTNMKGDASLSSQEAAVLMRTDIETGSRMLDVLRSTGLLEGVSASEAKRFHDWSKYRSKDEAKANAGRQGGRKSGESRRRQSKQTAKQNPKQKRSNPQAPDPDPDPLPLPDRSIDLSSQDQNEPMELEPVHQLGYPRYGELNGVMVQKIGRLCPILRWELRDAMSTQGRTWGYFAKVIESIREESAKPKSPPGQRQKTMKERTAETAARVEEMLRKDGTIE